MNQAIFWAMISIPLILYLLGRSPDLFNLNPEPWTRPLFRGGNIAIGVMFGLSFLLMARKMPAVKDYLTVAAIGVMIISIAFSVSNVQQTFGIASTFISSHYLPIFLLLACTMLNLDIS